MTKPPLITLTTDFGEADPYVAAMKGVVWSRCPEARVADLGHQLPPQDVTAGALFLEGALPWFPPDAIHVAVVDPGVGGARRALAIAWRDGCLIVPDNGLASLVLQTAGDWEARSIESPDFMHPEPSATFHGRDVFAPAAARLAAGARFEDIGPPAERLAELPWAEPVREGGGLRGVVVHIDHFGNCMTNISMEFSALPAAVETAKAGAVPVRRTYGDAAGGEALALIGSTGRLEIAVRNGSAAAALGLGVGDAVQVNA